MEKTVCGPLLGEVEGEPGGCSSGGSTQSLTWRGKGKLGAGRGLVLCRLEREVGGKGRGLLDGMHCIASTLSLYHQLAHEREAGARLDSFAFWLYSMS